MPISKVTAKKKSLSKSKCEVVQGKVDLESYAKLDIYWRELGIAAPARRGLVDNKILTLNDLKRITESEFLQIHAIGPKATAIIHAEMRKRGVKFRPER